MKLTYAKYLFSFVSLLYSFNSFSIEELSFPKIWEQIVIYSPENKYINYMKMSSDKSIDRQNLYWLPGLYLNSQLISTNDPTLTFMNYLGEGQVKQDDFIPSRLNSPSNNVFTSTQAGLDYLIYDGNTRSSYLNAQRHVSKSLEYEKKSELMNLYVRALREYTKILVADEFYRELKDIQNNIDSIINNYRVGEKSNPVGYSGYLSLKSALNKVLIFKQDCVLNLKNSKIVLNLMAGIDKKDWNNPTITADNFTSMYFFNPDNSINSYKYLAELENLSVIREKINVEEAKYLPKIGVFSQANIYSGERDTNTSYTFGLYIKFNLSASDFGSAEEIELLAKSKEEASKIIYLSQKIINDSSNENSITIKNKIELIQKSEEILNEQIKVIGKLFKNGNASVAQISELYIKKIDLLANKFSLKNYLYESDLAKVSLSKRSLEPKDIWGIK
ncbi:TolC family protein [Fluviispira sanaruensis]|uniref:Transporter n=1 Tax=Fluviispira sanaruensis TaxID=2493639 RepID=A0A4V0P274_FLUSA|nr:TolC family protein [Fluviispira sanaruensis]BBH52237.1 transporter [Fluviispira sanaruensis]